MHLQQENTSSATADNTGSDFKKFILRRTAMSLFNRLFKESSSSEFSPVTRKYYFEYVK
jgi:hypothetical protein